MHSEAPQLTTPLTPSSPQPRLSPYESRLADTRCYKFPPRHIEYPASAQHGQRVGLKLGYNLRLRSLTMYSWAPFIGLIVVAAFCAIAWFASPKGENQTYVFLKPTEPTRQPHPVLWRIGLTCAQYLALNPRTFRDCYVYYVG